MGIISKMRRQNAIYWPPAVVDDFGKESHGTLVELVLVPHGGGNYRVRWQDKNEEYLDAEGTTRHSNAVVYAPVLPNSGEVEVGGFLWLGDRAALTSETEPRSNTGAHEIRRFDKLPNLKATEYLRTAYL